MPIAIIIASAAPEAPAAFALLRRSRNQLSIPASSR